MSDVEKVVDLPVAPSDVWESLTDPDLLGEWFGAEVDGDIELGEVATFTFPDGTTGRALVDESIEPRRLAFRWLGVEEPTRIEFDLEPNADGTRLRVVERQITPA